MADDAPSKTDWLANLVLRSLIDGIMMLPYRRRVRAMGWLVRRIICPLAGYRRQSMENLTLIYPNMAFAERRRIADAVCDNFGRTLIENYSGLAFAAHLKNAKITGNGLAAVAKAHTAGRPVIFVTGHFGNHEAPRQVLTTMGYKIGGLFRPMQNQFFNTHYARTMTDMSGPVFEQGHRGTMGFVRFLRDGGMGTLLFDVRVVKVPKIDFLGHPALTATSAADFALRFDALLVPYFGIRQPDGLSFEIAIEDPISHTDALTMTTEMTRRLEARIAVNPEQWFWVHRRWRN